MSADGRLETATIDGLRLVSLWEAWVITLASKLCLRQQRCNEGLAWLEPRAGRETESRNHRPVLEPGIPG